MIWKEPHIVQEMADIKPFETKDFKREDIGSEALLFSFDVCGDVTPVGGHSLKLRGC